MLELQKLKLASLLYKYMFPLYRKVYFSFKNRKDAHHLRLIERLIKPGNNILDIGANIGFFTKYLSEKTGSSGHVYSFEPDETNFQHLRNELEGILNVTLIKKAVASDSGTLTLYTSTLLNVDHRTYVPENYSGKISVEKISIDEFVGGRFSIDLIKLDIQGFEMEALKGMKHTLEKNKDVVVFAELWEYGLQKAGSSAKAVYNFLTELGFNIYEVNAELHPLSIEKVSAIRNDFFSDIHILATRNKL